jgi:DNA-binding beta-propeller fold protein YncE
MGGDTLVFDVQGGDNVEVGTVGYLTRGAWTSADSAGGGTQFAQLFMRPVVPETGAGPFDVSFFVVDAAGNRVSAPYDTSFVLVQPTVHDVALGPYTGGSPFDVVYDPVRDRIYMSQADDRRIATFDATTAQPTGTIALPGRPGGLDVTSSGDSIVVALQDSMYLGVVDLTGGSPTVDTVRLSLASLLTVRVGGNVAVVSGVVGAVPRVVTYDLNGGAEQGYPDVLSDGVPWAFAWLARSATGERITVLEDGRCCELRAWMFDAQALSFGPTTPTVAMTFVPTPLSVDRDGGRFLIGTTIYSPALDSIATPIPHAAAFRAVLAADGMSLFVTQRFGFYQVSASDGSVLDAVRLSFIPEGLLVIPDGTRLVVYGANQIAVIRL